MSWKRALDVVVHDDMCFFSVVGDNCTSLHDLTGTDKVDLEVRKVQYIFQLHVLIVVGIDNNCANRFAVVMVRGVVSG